MFGLTSVVSFAPVIHESTASCVAEAFFRLKISDSQMDK